MWALVGSGVASLRIYSIWGGLWLGVLWAPACSAWARLGSGVVSIRIFCFDIVKSCEPRWSSGRRALRGACFWGLKNKHFWLRGCGPPLYIFMGSVRFPGPPDLGSLVKCYWVIVFLKDQQVQYHPFVFSYCKSNWQRIWNTLGFYHLNNFCEFKSTASALQHCKKGCL